MPKQDSAVRRSQSVVTVDVVAATAVAVNWWRRQHWRRVRERRLLKGGPLQSNIADLRRE